MVHARVCHKAKSCLADPLPKHDILVHGVRLELAFRIQVKDLQCALGLEGNDVFGPVHDSAVGFDGSPRDIVAIVEINDNDLGRSFVALLSHADVAIAF